MFTFVSLTLALAVGSAMASPIPQDPESSTGSPTAVVDPMPTAPVCGQSYTAVAGDTCQSIGDKFSLTAAQIHDANPFLTCDNIWAWTPVCIPAGGSTPPPSSCATTYTSEADDTCASIEAKFGLPAGAIKAVNEYVNCDDIWVYTPICLPSGPTYTATLPTATLPAATEAPTVAPTDIPEPEIL